MLKTKGVIFMVLPLLLVPLVYGISFTPDACAADMNPNWGDPSRCSPVSGTLEGNECCWDQEVPEGTGKDGGNTEEYCQTCYFGSGGTTLLYCDDPELQFRPIPTTNLPTLEQVPPTPLFGQNIPQDLPTLTEIPETPPTPLPPPPTDPFTTPEDDQNVVDENGDKEDGTPTRPPLRENLPELKEVPEDDQPEQDEEPSNEEQEDSSEGAETAGPLT